jgi:hypothetical protein
MEDRPVCASCGQPLYKTAIYDSGKREHARQRVWCGNNECKEFGRMIDVEREEPSE